MSTKIEWAEETWNPVIGCSRVSPGCDNCYAEKMAFRIANMQIQSPYLNVVKGEKWAHFKNPKQGWNGTTHLVESALEKPFNWKKPRRIFVCSMGDLFHESVPFEWIDEVINVIRWAKQHTFLFLTKRPGRMSEYFNKHVPEKYLMDKGNALDNLWLGVTAENQQMADQRIPILLSIPAAKRFVSIEPMLGPVDLEQIITPKGIHGQSTLSYSNYVEQLDWVIVGGESGPNARPMHPDWVRSIRDQCQEANTPFMFKQWGEYTEGSGKGGKLYAIANNGDFVQWNDPDEWRVFTNKFEREWSNIKPTIVGKVGKKKAGRELEGRIYNEYP